MAITQSGTPTTATNSTAGTSCAPAIPTGMTSSHLMVLAVCVFGDKTASLNTPAGWTKQATFVANTNTLAVYTRVWVSGDGAPSVTWTSTNKNVGTIVPFLGCDLTTPVDVAAPTFATGTSVSPASPTQAAVTRGACRVHIAGRSGTSTSTPDFRTKEAVDITTSSTSPAALAFEYELGMAEGAQGARTSTVTSAAWVAATLWLRPAAVATFGLLRSAKASTAGTGATSVTASLAAGDVTNAPPNTLIVARTAIWSAGTNTCTGVSYGAGATTLTQVGTGSQAPASSTQVSVWHKMGATLSGAAASVIATRSGTDSMELLVSEYAGALVASALDQSGTASATNTAMTVTNSGTPTNQTELAVAVFSVDTSGTTLTPDTNYIGRYTQISGAAGFVAAMFEDREVATAGAAQTALGTDASSANYAAMIALFKPVDVPLMPHLEVFSPLYSM